MRCLIAFLGGALTGATLALLFAPEKGEDLRNQVKEILRRHGFCCGCSEEDEIVDQIIAEIQEEK